MLYRKAADDIRKWFDEDDRTALLVTGARQVGKTFLIRSIMEEKARSFVEINLLEDEDSLSLFRNARSAKDLLLRLSVSVSTPLIPGETVIFLDEVQVCENLLTMIKFLVDDGTYRFILSGSLLGITLSEILSAPVGYLSLLRMYPLDMKEFFIANGVSDDVLSYLRTCFVDRSPVDGYIHEKLMDILHLYLVVGGMPAAVQKYLDTGNIRQVVEMQNFINALYRVDISRYDKADKLHIQDIYDIIPAELNNQNKRFILKDMNRKKIFSYYEDSFLWLKNAGVAHPVYCADEARLPLKLSSNTNLFKLFLCDTGLLCAMFMNGIQVRLLNKEISINYGSVYENMVAQELASKGFDLYYYRNKRIGEIDFLIELNGEVVPLEIKSGKDYKVHNALNNLLDNKDLDIRNAYIFSNANLSTDGPKTYLPVYMLMFLENRRDLPEVYRLAPIEIGGVKGINQ